MDLLPLSLKIAIVLVPVCAFAVSLVYLDSYKLVRFRQLLQVVAAGGLAAVLSYFTNRTVMDVAGLDQQTVTRFVAPLVEEILKAMPIILLLRAKRVGFLVDAAIFGFASGAGFALVENLYYLWAVSETSIGLAMVRGFGTAIMHGGTTAIFATATKVMFERKESESIALALPGLAIAFSIHSLFNQFMLPPVASAVLVMLVLPPIFLFVFAQSERFLQSWLGKGFDIDSELLEALQAGEFTLSRSGRYLQTLREHFEPVVLGDMICYLRLHAELSLRAKGVLLMKEKGFPIAPDPEVAAKLAELKFLEKSIGRTGERALAPVLHRSAHDLWQLRMLESSEGTAA
jgi:protease PrsW